MISFRDFSGDPSPGILTKTSLAISTGIVLEIASVFLPELFSRTPIRIHQGIETGILTGISSEIIQGIYPGIPQGVFYRNYIRDSFRYFCWVSSCGFSCNYSRNSFRDISRNFI